MMLTQRLAQFIKSLGRGACYFATRSHHEIAAAAALPNMKWECRKISSGLLSFLIMIPPAGQRFGKVVLGRGANDIVHHLILETFGMTKDAVAGIAFCTSSIVCLLLLAVLSLV